MSNNSIWHIDRILSGAFTLAESGPGSNDNEEILLFPQSSIVQLAGAVEYTDCTSAEG